MNLIDPYGLAWDWVAIRKGSWKIVGGGAAVFAGALAASTPTGVGQVAGTALALGGSSSFGFGVGEVITGFMGKDIPFGGAKEAIITGTTPPGVTRNTLLGVNEIIDMIPSLVAGGNIPPSKMLEAIGFIKHSLSIAKSAKQIIEELKAYGYINIKCH